MNGEGDLRIEVRRSYERYEFTIYMTHPRFEEPIKMALNDQQSVRDCAVVFLIGRHYWTLGEASQYVKDLLENLINALEEKQ